MIKGIFNPSPGHKMCEKLWIFNNLKQTGILSYPPFAKFCAQWYEIIAVSCVRLERMFLGVGGVTNANPKM